MNPKLAFRVLIWTALLASGVGCIERKVTIRTVPEGATVLLNDQEVGQSPVSVPFTWYGDYDVICRKSGFRTERQVVRLETPWYELPGIDLFTEVLLPVTVRDHRERTIELAPLELPTRNELLQRANEHRGQSATALAAPQPAVQAVETQPVQ